MSVEFTAITAGLSATKTGFDLIRGIRESLSKPDIKPIDIQQALLQLQSLMLEAQRGLADAQAEINTLRNRLEDREAIKAIEADLEFEHDGNFWVRKSERHKGLIPYCPACWGKDQKLVAMGPYMKPGVVKCPLHETAYTTTAYEEWVRQQRARQGNASVNRPSRFRL